MIHSRLFLTATLTSICLLPACDSGEGKPAGGDTAKAEPEKAEDDAKAADDAKPDDAKDEKAPEEAAPEVHFDVGHDKSGIVARTAAVLEAEEKIDSEDLRSLSHHAENLPSFEALCKHVGELRATSFDLAQCIKDAEHHIVQIGPELYGEYAACEMAATTVAELDACEAAEKEAEEKLHATPHGEGLDDAACESFFTQFEILAVADAGEQADLVKEILAEVKPDVIITCKEQGTKAELECAAKSKTLHELDECAASLI